MHGLGYTSALVGLVGVIAVLVPAPTAGVEHRCIHDDQDFPRPTVSVVHQTVDGYEFDRRTLASGSSASSSAVPSSSTSDRRGLHGLAKAAPVNGTQPLRIVVRHLWKSSPSLDPFMCQAAGDTVESSTNPGTQVLCRSEHIMGSAKENKLISDVEEAVAFLARVLYVLPVSGNLQLDKARDCNPAASFFGMVPDGDFVDGVPGADFVLYITTRPAPPGVLAFASTCQTDQRDRPIMGHANWGPENIDVAAGQESVVIGTHEITHALGFSTDGFGKFRNPLKPDERLPKEQVISESELTRNGATYTVSKMITPKVREFVQRHFLCATGELDGAEIENGGGLGTAGSHWEKRLFGSDFMTGSKSSKPLITGLTFAALQDSTWYAVDFDEITDQNPIGAGEGCAFATGPCSAWDPKYLCQDATAVSGQVTRCSADRRFKSYCDVCDWDPALGRSDCGSAPAPPPEFQYFGKATMGGRSLTGDYCPLITPFDDNSDCQNPAHFNPSTSTRRDEVFGPQSMCVSAKVTTVDPDGTTFNFPTEASCYRAECSKSTELRITFASGGSVVCTTTGNEVDAPTGYSGSLTCPDVTAVCATTTNNFHYPEVTSVAPSTGRKGSTLTIHGRDFGLASTDVILRTAEGRPFNCSAMSVLTTSMINCTLPASYDGSVQVSVMDLETNITSTSAPGAFLIDVDTSDEIPDSGGEVSDPLGDFGKDAADAVSNAADDAVGWWSSFNDGCGGTVPCWVFPAASVLLLVVICGVCCCRKKKAKSKEEEYAPPPHLQGRGQPRGQARGGSRV